MAYSMSPLTPIPAEAEELVVTDDAGFQYFGIRVEGVVYDRVGYQGFGPEKLGPIPSSHTTMPHEQWERERA